MSENSSIEWTDATWNPVRGCTKISPGCTHCYAETFAERFRGVAGHPYEQGFDLRLVPEKLTEPLKWAAPKTVFVNSMSDLFHEAVPDSYIEQVVRVMEVADWHTYQVLTKRAGRLREMLSGPLASAAELSHIWWGVSVENRKHGLPRIDELRSSGSRPLPLDRTVARGSRQNQPHRNRLGDCRRRKRLGSAPDGPGMGHRHPRSVPSGRCPVLLQTMGRRAKVKARPEAGWPHVR